MEKIYNYLFYGRNIEVKVQKDTYNSNGTLAVILMSKPSPEDVEAYGLSDEIANSFCEEFTVVTVNLPNSNLLPNEQFVDVYNNEGIELWLMENGIAEPTEKVGYSGFCVYPVYRFNI